MACLTRRFVLIFAASSVLAGPTARAAPEAPLVLAVQPYLAPADIVARFTPLAEALARALGRPVLVRVGRTYEDLIDAIGTDSVDIAYLGPAPYVTLVNRYGPRPLLARQVVNGDPLFHGEIVVRGDSPIRSLADLTGKSFAFGDAHSAAGHVIPESMMRRAGVPESALSQHKFLGANRNVALAVLAGDYDAGAVKEEVFNEFSARGLRSIATLTPVAEHAFVASRRLPDAVVATLREALLGLGQTAEGQSAMRAIEPGLNEFVPGADSDYDGMRALMDLPLRRTMK